MTYARKTCPDCGAEFVTETDAGRCDDCRDYAKNVKAAAPSGGGWTKPSDRFDPPPRACGEPS